MQVELADRAAARPSETEETPPSSPDAAASAAEDAPLLPGGGGVVGRRVVVSERFRQRSGSFWREVRRAAEETFLLTRLTLILLRYLGIGYRWIRQFLALCCYTFLLMPGFIQVVYYYFFSSQVCRSVVYGEQPRNRLDLYIPTNKTGLKPVVAFVTGGAWIIGYKGWGALLGRRLAERGILVACIDYRNFPQGTIGDMVEDASQGVAFVCNNIASYGGDPERIYLVGQSAGAHIAACTLLRQAIKESGEGDASTWSIAQLKAYFGISGGDSGVPDLKVDNGAKADLFLYDGKTHTDLFLQDPLRGGRDKLLEEIITVINNDNPDASTHHLVVPVARRLVPEFMLMLAGRVSPF